MKLQAISFIAKPNFWKVLFPSFYFISLFPSRNHWDTVETLRLSRNGQSLDQWTAIYFRYLELLSLGGKFAFFASLVGLIGLSYSTCFFIDSLPISKRGREIGTIIALATPFVGVFGMTLTHEVQTVTGSLILTGILLRRMQSNEYSSKAWFIFIAFIYCAMTFVGVLIISGYLISLMSRKNAMRYTILIVVIVVLNLFSSSILRVAKVDSATNLQSVLGDMKCITQHPDAVISPSQWKQLESFGEISKWKESVTCSTTSVTVLFTAPQVSNRERELISLWANLVRQNPQIALQARIQRAAMALPPPFFQSQPNFSSRNFLEPVGLGTQDDLQQWSPVFKTSNDDPYQKENYPAPSFLKPLEYVALLFAFIINGQSWFWGWGGLWFLIFTLVLITRTQFSYGSISRILLPHVLTIIGLFVGSPVSDPRYAMSLTCVGIFTSIAFLVDYLVRRKEIL